MSVTQDYDVPLMQLAHGSPIPPYQCKACSEIVPDVLGALHLDPDSMLHAYCPNCDMRDTLVELPVVLA